MNSSPFIYADHNSTSPLCDSAREKMLPFLAEEYGNPSSFSYSLGKRAKLAVEEARGHVASFLGAKHEEVVFVSGGSESCFQAVIGSLLWHLENKRESKYQFISSMAEHSAVYKSIETAQKFLTCEQKYIELTSLGDLSLDKLKDFFKNSDYSFLSVMGANNETGVCFPIKKIASLLDSEKITFHSDLIQMVGKKDFKFSASGLDLASISSHKISGPKGVGALLVGEGSRWSPAMPSGGQESGRRGGTHAVANIVGFGEAARIKKEFLQNTLNAFAARDCFEKKLQSALLNKVRFIGDACERLNNTSNVIFDGVAGTDLVEALAKKDICISKGSACKASEGGLSKAHSAMGLSERESRCSVRVSLAADSTVSDASLLAEAILGEVQNLRSNVENELRNLIT